MELYGLLDKGPTSHTYQETFFEPVYGHDDNLQMDSIPRRFRKTGLPDFLRDRPDDSIRCRECGMTIAEHSNAPVGRIDDHRRSDDSEPPTKRGRTEPAQTFAACLEKLDAEGAIEALMQLVRTVDNKADGAYCIPHKLGTTWKAKKWKENLLNGRMKLEQGLTNDGGRFARVMGLHCGTGTGKTHILLDAGSMLEAKKSLYLTYNLEQDLAFDTQYPRIAVLLRVLLRLKDIGNVAADRLLCKYGNVFRTLDENHLLRLTVTLVAKELSGFPSATTSIETRTDLFIGVDEIRKLLISDADTSRAIVSVTSTLGGLARELRKEGVACTCVVSALTANTFRATSDRPVYGLSYVPAKRAATSAVLQEIFKKETPSVWVTAMVEACAGTHFRSLVVACQALKKTPQVEITVPQLFDLIREGLSTKMSCEEQHAIRQYVFSCVQSGHENALGSAPLAAPFIDADGAVAPVLLLVAFPEENDANLLLDFFSTSAKVDPAKQLERCNMLYDQFRAYNQLPVVPRGVPVVDRFTNANWYEYAST